MVATAGGAAKAQRLRALGVHRVIDYKREARPPTGTQDLRPAPKVQRLRALGVHRVTDYKREARPLD